MESLIVDYQKKISTLLDFINSTREIEKLVRTKDHDAIFSEMKGFYRSPSKKTYDYNLVIITLYGLLESYIEECITVYLQKLPQYVSKYSSLSPKFRETHIMATADMIKNSEKMGKFKDIDKEEAINNLSGCLQDISAYQINARAFTYHSANYRPDTINTAFVNIGLDNLLDSITKSGIIKKYYSETEAMDASDFEQYDKSAKEKGVANHKFFEILVDLVERRNGIAHGVTPEELLSLDILANYVNYVKALIETIHTIVVNKLEKIWFENAPKKEIGTARHIYGKKNIIAIDSNNTNIRVGMKIYGKNDSSQSYEIGKVLSISVDSRNDELVPEIFEKENEYIAIKVDFSPKESYIYGIIVE